MSDIDYTLTEEEIQFSLEYKEPGSLVAHLLINDVLFLNTNWSEKEWPEEARHGVILLINCNDCFGPYADCERIQLNEISILYKLWRRDPDYGPIAWVMAKRKQRTWSHKKIEERMKELGWDIDALVRGELPT